MYEAKLKCDDYDYITSRGIGTTEIEALQELRKSSKKFELSLDQLEKEYAVIREVDITNEVKKQKKQADKILNRLQDILNMIPKYDNGIYVWGQKSRDGESYNIIITHNLCSIRDELERSYERIFKANTTKNIFKFRQFVSDIHEQFTIKTNHWSHYYPNDGNEQKRELKEIATYTFINPGNVNNSNLLCCHYFGNLDQDFCVDFNSKYANEILASSFATRGYMTK